MPPSTHPEILRPCLATPLTPLATSVYFEQFKPHFDKGRARHLHFTWDETKLRLDTSNLKPVPIGEWRYSREGVRYQQIYVENPWHLEFYIDGNQFQVQNFDGSVGYKDGFYFVMRNERHFPDGALYALDPEKRGWVRDPMGYTIARCGKDGGRVVLGRPTVPPVHWVDSFDRRFARSVREVVRSISRKLTGKRRDIE